MGPSGCFTLVGIILHCLGQLYAGFVFKQERVGRAAGRPGRADAAGARWVSGRQAGASGACSARARRALGARGLCAPGCVGWAVGCALGALSLFFT